MTKKTGGTKSIVYVTAYPKIDGPGFRQNKSNYFFNQETLKLHNQKCHNAWSTFPLEGYFDKQ